MKKLLPAKTFNAIKDALKESKQGDLVKTVNARDVHAWLGVKTKFTMWIERRIERLMLIENIDYVVIGENVSQASNDGLPKNGQRDFQGKIEYHLTPDAVKQVAMGEDGEKGKLVKLYFIDCETIAKDKSVKAELRQTLSVEFRPMTDAIMDDHENPQHYHYSNECDMINRIVLGMTSKKFKAVHGYALDTPTRDVISPEQQQAIIDLQRANTVFIRMGKSFDERKIDLQNYFDKNCARKLELEIFAIES